MPLAGIAPHVDRVAEPFTEIAARPRANLSALSDLAIPFSTGGRRASPPSAASATLARARIRIAKPRAALH